VLAYPNPVELVKLVDLETVTNHRSLFCTHYDDCLDRAAEFAWPSWTCGQCPLYALRREMAARYATDHHGCAHRDDRPHALHV
jgi:hypothetical protein